MSNPPSSPRPTVAVTGHDALPVGTRFGEFEILRVLGVGGFGIVYLAHDHSLERMVALKEYMPASLAARGQGPQITVRSTSFAETYAIGLRSFINEARLLARFDHPSLVKVYRFWEDNATAYMVMPFLQGITLRDTRKGMVQPPDEAWIRSVVAPILAALDLLHREGVYHRDIAPDNILLPVSGPPVLLDFGAARRVISGRTQSLTAILKPSYAPIEQYAEMTQLRQGPWTDLYALGAVIHYLLFGAPPAPATARAVEDDSETIEHRSVPGVSPRFLEVVTWMLAVRPNERPQSVEQLSAVLDGKAQIPPHRRQGITLPGTLVPTLRNPSAVAEAADSSTHVTAHMPTYLPTAPYRPAAEAGPPASASAAAAASAAVVSLSAGAAESGPAAAAAPPSNEPITAVEPPSPAVEPPPASRSAGPAGSAAAGTPESPFPTSLPPADARPVSPPASPPAPPPAPPPVSPPAPPPVPSSAAPGTRRWPALAGLAAVVAVVLVLAALAWQFGVTRDAAKDEPFEEVMEGPATPRSTGPAPVEGERSAPAPGSLLPYAGPAPRVRLPDAAPEPESAAPPPPPPTAGPVGPAGADVLPPLPQAAPPADANPATAATDARARPVRPPAARDPAAGSRDAAAARGAATARAACGKRGFIAMAVCMDQTCEEPRFRRTAECVPILERKRARENPSR